MRRAVFALAVALLVSGCARSFRYVRTTRPRTFDPGVPCPGPSGKGRLLATYHPPTHRAKGAHAPVVLFEPLLLSREVLDRGADGGLVPYLNYRGFPVWVVFADAPEALSTAALGRCHAMAVEAIATVTKARRVHVGGVSLGGQVTAHALGPLGRAGNVALGRVFFYAAGLDYAYPGSLLWELAAGRGAPLAASSCGDPACARWLSGGAGYLGSLPALTDDEGLPLAQRFPHLAAAREPVLFVSGKIDGAAPSESVFPVYELYRSAAGGTRKRIVIVGRENFLPDLDHWGMLGGAHEEGFEILADWLERE